MNGISVIILIIYVLLSLNYLRNIMIYLKKIADKT